MLHVYGVGEEEKCVQVLMGKAEVKRLLGRTQCKWEDNVKVDLKGTWLEVVGLIDTSQNINNCGAAINTLMEVSIVQNKGNLFSKQIYSKIG